MSISVKDGSSKKVIGENLSLNHKDELIKLGLSDTDTVDVISTQISSPPYNNYYMRFGTLLEFIQDHIFPKIVPGDKPYLRIDTETEGNIMYTIPNQLSTNPDVCLIKNSIPDGGLIFFQELENYIGEINKIQYGKVMNIYINFTYLKDLIESEGIVTSISIYKFLSNLCNSINSSLGGVNNLEPVVDEKSNTIVILEQTKIPGKNELIKTLGAKNPKPKKPPILEVFGYNTADNTSNFVRNVGLTTAITKEYATMITIGATAGGYIPGEEATAFSRWNKGIEDRFKKSLKDQDSSSEDPIETFEEDNLEIKKKYAMYLSQPFEEIIGATMEGTKEGFGPYIVDKEIIKVNTSAVSNFNRYLQASASIANPNPKDVETSVGFLPFNLSLTMDGIGGIKIYNKLEVNTKFLPSNYDNTMEFVITAVDHKISNNSWETSLSTVGTSRGTNNQSLIKIGVLPEVERHAMKGAEYVEEPPKDVSGAYEVMNGSPARGGWGRRYKFEDLGTHWPGTGGYTKYKTDQKMRTGEISVLSEDESILVYDLVMFREEGGIKTKRCSLPSPINGKITLSGYGKDSVTTIVGAEGIVKMLHMDKVYVEAGDTIKKGELIGRQGDVMSTKSVKPNVHLHIQSPRSVMINYIKMLTESSSPKTSEDIDETAARRGLKNNYYELPTISNKNQPLY